MDAVTVSPKYQVVIPLKVRERMHVKSGQKMHVIAYDKMVVFIPIRLCWLLGSSVSFFGFYAEISSGNQGGRFVSGQMSE